MDSLDCRDDDRLYYLGDQLFTGVAFTLNKDGTLKSEVTYRSGLRWGPAKEWYRTGQPMVDSDFFQGALHGRAREWHKNGQIAEDGEFECGITLWQKKWDENGNLESDVALKESDKGYQMLLNYRRLYGGAGGPVA
jgi:antitoxin component YwqK of YwqJK toxin-antitoxin module